jgi:pimeloyl-ACP methyl ester carboxylesterase
MKTNVKTWLALALLLAPPARAAMMLESCRLSAPRLPSVAADCGSLSVPENPAAPESRSITLFVARIASLDIAPQADPLVIIAGGPGQAATDLYLGLRAAFEPVRRDRDIILVDQRGTGKTGGLSCPLPAGPGLDLVPKEALPELMRACLASIEGDPRFFSTSVAVGDLERVREALGIAQWNLYGVSYGTRVAQHYLRRYPHHTRALLLDGVLPSEIAAGPGIAANAQRALDLILRRCAGEAACRGRFPDLAARLQSFRATLAESAIPVSFPDPLSGEPVDGEFSVDGLNGVLRLMSYSEQTAALLPLLIDNAAAGNVAPIAAQAEMIVREIETALSLAMHNAVVCTEDVPFFEGPETDAQSSSYLGSDVTDALRAACSVWPAGVLDDDLKTPLRSATPVLLLSGEADPITPPAYALQAGALLTRSRHLVVAGQGHGLAGFGCVPRLMREFLEQLAPEALDADCLSDHRPSPFFIGFNGPAP